MPHLLTLQGLRAEPLASYCAALGVLRLVTQQRDPNATAWWHHDRFMLRSTLDADALIDFFLHQYQPTPMASPWNAGGGFFNRAPDSAITEIERSDDPRFTSYRSALAVITDTLAAHELSDRPATPELKRALLDDLHRKLPQDARLYLDTAFSLESGEPRYHVIYLTGGNDSKVDFARSFMERLSRLLLRRNPESASLLQAALFDTITDGLERLTSGAHNPATTGGLSASSEEPDATALTNPWTYVLGMEGALLLADGRGEAPHRPAGYPAAIADEGRRSDLHLPLWSGPSTLSQLQDRLCVEPSSPTVRYSFLPRNGRAHFAIPVMRHSPGRPAYIEELEQQLQPIRSRELEQALVEDTPNATRILEILGSLRQPHTELPRLSQEWISAADDGSPEFGCALALSGLGGGITTPGLVLSEQLAHFVGRDLCRRMISLLRVRTRRADQVSKLLTPGGYPRFNGPFWSAHPVRPRHLEAFLAGRVDDSRVERLFRALCRVAEDRPVETGTESAAFLPYPFAVAKLAFHQHGDRRPARVEIVDALISNQPDQAVSLSARFLSERHPDFPQDWPKCPRLSLSTARRWAAALLFPISDATYEQILGDLRAH